MTTDPYLADAREALCDCLKRHTNGHEDCCASWHGRAFPVAAAIRKAVEAERAKWDRGESDGSKSSR